MEFKSIEEIQKYFGLTKTSFEDLRKELLVILAEFHPDKTGGSFKNKIQERNYEEISSAIQFLEELSTVTSVSKHELSVILKKIDELSIIASEKNVESLGIDKTVEKLEHTINTSIIQFHKKYLFPKISSLALTGILTVLWSFPSIASEHPILKQYDISHSHVLTLVWFLSLFATGSFWIMIKRQERYDEQLKKRYSFDTTQNSIFKLFLCWVRVYNYRAVDYNSHRTIITFTKDELVNFTLNHYDRLEREFRNSLNIDFFELYSLMQKAYKNKDFTESHNVNIMFPLSFFRPGRIDIDFAQQVSETIINKLLKKKIIKVSEKQSFGDAYEYVYK